MARASAIQDGVGWSSLGFNLKIRSVLAGVALAVAAVSSASAADTAIFGFTPAGVQTMNINGLNSNINAFTHGWFIQTGEHDANNNNYAVGDFGGNTYRNYFYFDSLTGVTSAEFDIGADPSGFLFGGHSSVTWTLYDLNAAINTNQDYMDTSIFDDLGTGVVYGSVTLTAPTSNVVVDLNSAGIAALNAAGLTGSEFGFGGVLTFSGGVPEPATWAMGMLGFGLLGSALRRRRQGALTTA